MSLRVAFFGLPLAACLLKRDGHELVLAVLSPIPAPGRRRLLRTSPHMPILVATPGDRSGPKKVAFDRTVEEALARAEPDLIVSWFWTRRLEARWLARAPRGGIGAHPSLLPRHRGPNPYFAAIDAGDAETGVSVHALTPEYDTGDVLLVRRLSIGERDSWQLARALDRPSLSLLREVVGHFARGTPPRPEPQHEDDATWAPEPSGEALRVHWTWPNERVLRRIRAL
ncbi:MAG TPA: formyltransferase family protein, partial [Polyangiaceae bacterium]|nr:formyltransferase family protein [Polyangiaceae bacterium]